MIKTALNHVKGCYYALVGKSVFTILTKLICKNYNRGNNIKQRD